MNVTTTVYLVTCTLITVPLVIHQESESQIVSAQMVSMITEIPVSVVLITVPLVTQTEIPVPLVPPSESMSQCVTAQLVTMMTVLLNVSIVHLKWLLVTGPNKDIQLPLLVPTHLIEDYQIVNVQLDGKIILTELTVLKNHIQMVLTT